MAKMTDAAVLLKRRGTQYHWSSEKTASYLHCTTMSAGWLLSGVSSGQKPSLYQTLADSERLQARATGQTL